MRRRIGTLHCNLGDALHAQGKLAEAVKFYNRTLELNPNHFKAGNCLCNANFDLGNLAELGLVVRADAGHQAGLRRRADESMPVATTFGRLRQRVAQL